MKKLLYLFLALLFPVLIFIFLKYAGKNEFDIPVYYAEEVSSPPRDCGMDYTAPYLVPDAFVMRMGASFGEANLIIFPDQGLDASNLMSRINDEFGNGEVRFIDVAVLKNPDDLKKCVFLVKAPNQAVLFDKEKRIRGYYDLRSREEEDRLRVELKILLKKY